MTRAPESKRHDARGSEIAFLISRNGGLIMKTKKKSSQAKKTAGKSARKKGAVTRQPSGRAKRFLPTEKPDTMEAAKHHQPEFDTDIEDPRAYRERQESYMTEDMLEDPGTFEN